MKKNKQTSYERLRKWHKYVFASAIVVFLGAFFLIEPWDEFTLYIGWSIWGVSIFIWGYAAVACKQADYQVLEGGMWAVGAEGESQGKRATFLGVMAIIFSILMFIVPGIALAAEILFGYKTF